MPADHSPRAAEWLRVLSTPTAELSDADILVRGQSYAAVGNATAAMQMYRLILEQQFDPAPSRDGQTFQLRPNLRPVELVRPPE